MAAIFLIAVATLFAADPTGTIVGTVLDPTGGVVVDAEVRARNVEMSLDRTVRSTAVGDFSVPLLPPGVYEIIVSVPNFRRSIHQGVDVRVGSVARVDIHLQLGELRESIIVTAPPPLIQMDSPTMGQVVSREEILTLPLNERNFLNLTLLVPGAQLPAEGSQNSTLGAAVSVNGLREQSNNFLLDGVDNNDVGLNTYSALPSQDAIYEFRVQANNSSAEFGRSGGAQINVILKSGTNSVHGTAFEFFRNRHLDAKNFFDKPYCTPTSPINSCGDIPGYDRNQFGGSIGGALRRDKTFYFLSFERLQLRQAVTREATVPSLAERNQALSAVPASQRNVAGQAIFDQFPQSNAGADLLTSNRFIATPVQRVTLNQFTTKFDHRLTENQMLSGHYSISDEDRYNPYDPFLAFTSLPGFGTFIQTRGQSARISWTYALGTRSVNDMRMGFNRDSGAMLQEHYGTSFSERLGFPNVSAVPTDLGFPNVVVGGFDGIGEPINTPNGRGVNTFHFSDTLAWNPEWGGGRHRLKVGADIRRIQLNFYLDLLSRGVWRFAGVFTGNPLQDLLRGLPVVAISGQGHTASGMRTTHMNYFIQDDIQVSPRFTLNVGLRYEFNSPPVEVRDRLSVPDTTDASKTCAPQPDCAFILAGTAGVPRATFNPDRNNFAPRIGFAWRPWTSDRFVVRSAYGIFYDVPIMNLNIGPRFNPPFFRTVIFPNLGASTIQDIMQGGGVPLPVAPFVIAGDFRDPYVQHWSFGLQFGLSSTTAMEIAYVGTKGTSLINRRNPNQPLPGGVAPYPQFGPWQYYESGSSSSYNSLQLRVEKRLSGGLSALVAYTWSNSLDNASALFGSYAEPALPQNSRDMRAERGLSNFNARHRFVTSYVYELPFGAGRSLAPQSRLLQHVLGNWQLSGIITAQTGRPFTVNRIVDQSGTGTNAIADADRPDQIADPFTAGPVANHPDPTCRTTTADGGRAATSVRTPGSWFNPCAFAAAPGRFGTAGRNNILGPGLFSWDFAVLRNIPLGMDKDYLQLRFEAFNVLNHPNFDLPDRVFDSQTFGQIRSSNAFGHKPPRQIQIGLKYIF